MGEDQDEVTGTLAFLMNDTIKIKSLENKKIYSIYTGCWTHKGFDIHLVFVLFC